MSFKAIGVPRTADIYRRAIAIAFPDGLPSTPGAISSDAADLTDDSR
jgi:hypothetical protein